MKKGVPFLEDGSRYEGEFKDGFYHGSGAFRSHDGDKFVGELNAGQLKKGWVNYEDGDWYKGSLLNEPGVE
jgi:hypothetical protein